MSYFLKQKAENDQGSNKYISEANVVRVSRINIPDDIVVDYSGDYYQDSDKEPDQDFHRQRIDINENFGEDIGGNHANLSLKMPSIELQANLDQDAAEDC